MTGARRLFIDRSPGETRIVVTLDGRPERLVIEREDDAPAHRPGARLVGRVRRIDRSLATAFVDIGVAPDAVMPLSAGLAEGARVAVEVTAPPRWDKGATVRPMGPGEGEPRLLSPAPSSVERLGLDPHSAVTGPQAREIADAAEAEALAVVHRLSGGGDIAVEVTRGLVAIDVDVGPARGDARRAAAAANRDAISTAARLLRLKGLGGPVAIDLAGRGQDGEALRQVAEAAFAPDQPGVAFGPVSRFGVWTLSLPRRFAPVAERLCGPDGRLTARTVALRMLRTIEREAGAGGRAEALAHPEAAAEALTWAPGLVERIGARFVILPDAAVPLETPLVRPI